MRRGSKVLVAGGAGFIGSHLVDRLIARGDDVVVVDNFRTGRRANLPDHPALRVVTADVIAALPPELDDLRFERIYNLACPASPPRYQEDPEHTLLTSVVGTSQLLRRAERDGARFLLTSTSEVYGDPEQHPQREEHRGWVSCTGPRACYDEGKRAAETLCFDYERAGRGDVRVMRIFNTYGPRMDPDDGRIVSNIVCQALTGAPITIYGDGTQTRSYCFVDDLVRGMIGFMDRDLRRPGPVNFGNPNEISVSDLVDLVLDLTGSRSAVTYLPLPEDDPRRRRPDIGRAEALLGWRPEIDLEQGISATIAHFAAILDAGDGELAERLAAAE